MVDFKSCIDLESRLDKNQALKIIIQLLKNTPSLVYFSKHCRIQMKSRDLRVGDIINVLGAGKILNDPEYEKASWRYKVQTQKISVVIALRSPNHIIIVTAWRN